MHEKTECPKCKNVFSVKNHLKYRARFNLSLMKMAFKNIAFPWSDGLEEIYNPHIVVCPECGNVFSSIEYKYFGFIKAKHLQIGLIAAFLFFVFAPLVVIILKVVK